MGSRAGGVQMLLGASSLSRVPRPAARISKCVGQATIATYRVPSVENENNVSFSVRRIWFRGLLTVIRGDMLKDPWTEQASRLH